MQKRGRKVDTKNRQRNLGTKEIEGETLAENRKRNLGAREREKGGQLALGLRLHNCSGQNCLGT